LPQLGQNFAAVGNACPHRPHRALTDVVDWSLRTLITSAIGKSLLRSLGAQGLSVRSIMASMVGPASGYARATQATLLGHSTFAIQRSIKA